MIKFLGTRKVIIIVSIIIYIFWFKPADATVYFYWDAESHPCDGSVLPNPPFWTQEVSYRGHVVCGSAPQGSRFFEFQTVNNQTHHYTEIHPAPTFPITNILNKTLYLAYHFNFTRIDGRNIWHQTGQSGDKGLELQGSGIRWIVSRGHWENLANNTDHRYTIWGGNPSYHLNPSLENTDILRPNQSGYSASNPIQLTYETWHSAVMAVKVAADNTGSFTVWIDGVKILQYDNIRTAANSSPTIQNITMGGTIAQPAYDSPAHKRQFDALILTDNWQDIINGGYVTDLPPAPAAPSGLRIIPPSN
jgi:hypothetical protein